MTFNLLYDTLNTLASALAGLIILGGTEYTKLVIDFVNMLLEHLT